MPADEPHVEVQAEAALEPQAIQPVEVAPPPAPEGLGQLVAAVEGPLWWPPRAGSTRPGDINPKFWALFGPSVRAAEIKRRADALAAADLAAVQLVPALAAWSVLDADVVDLLFEFACSDTSSLGVVATEHGVQAHRMTLATGDLSTQAGLDKAIANLQAVACKHPKRRLHAHGSLPCTAWCRWHSINAARWGEGLQGQACHQAGAQSPHACQLHCLRQAGCVPRRHD